MGLEVGRISIRFLLWRGEVGLGGRAVKDNRKEDIWKKKPRGGAQKWARCRLS